jgi:hypothetical protein
VWWPGVGGDHGFGGFAVSAGFLAGLGRQPFGNDGGGDAGLDLGDAVGGESGVDPLLDGSAGGGGAALGGGLLCRWRRWRRGGRRAGRFLAAGTGRLGWAWVRGADGAEPGRLVAVFEFSFPGPAAGPGAGEAEGAARGLDYFHEPGAGAGRVGCQPGVQVAGCGGV